ncbi:class I SAM-dependent methyltransferase [Pseudobacteriovorax antillogorgiicola]|nr:methyltransferase domain-containing protein [Pseudobacteriovorax antillogorgiicola]
MTLRYESFADFDTEVSKALDQIEHDDQAPLFGDLWPSAEALCHYLLEESLQAKSVLEIGCGLGLPSILASKLGAKVIASDYHPHSEAFVLRNRELNDAKVEFKQIDWRSPSELPPQDMIIASDILYEPQTYPDLALFIQLHCHKRTKVLIADPERVFSSQFEAVMENCGLKLLRKWHDGNIILKVWELA